MNSYTNKKLSVIITAYSEHEITVVHIREAMNANHTPDEIIVVNDGGDPRLFRMIEDELPKKKRKCKIIYARINEDILWNYPGAVNLGAWLSTGEYLAFEDNDNIPSRTFYDQAIEKFEEFPEVGRIQANKRQRMTKWAFLTKPFEEWKPMKPGIGPNMGTAMIRRDVVLMLKGQDERLSGSYGWMYIDWRWKMIAQAKIKFGSVGFYWYVLNAQSNLSRRRTSHNLKIRRENCRAAKPHNKHPMLNFTYTMKILDKYERRLPKIKK